MPFSLLVMQAKSYLMKEIIVTVNFVYQAYSFKLLVQMKGKTKRIVNILPRNPSMFCGHLKHINKYKYFRKDSCSWALKAKDLM